MTTGRGGDTCFIDTNVLVYAHDQYEQDRRPVAQQILERLWRNREGAVSTQVLQEFYVVATRKFTPPMSRRAARDLVGAYGEWQLVRPDAAMVIAASLLEERFSISFWDALIVEAARRAGARRLLTEDLQHGQSLAGVRVENPFSSD